MKVMFSLVIALSLVFFAFIAIGDAFTDDRKEDLRRIGSKYELVEFEFDLNSDSPTMSFTGYGRTFTLSLSVNEHIIGNQILNHKGQAHNGYFGELTESCHYQTSFEMISGDSVDVISGYGGISLCPKRGVRGRLRWFNDTLIIRPAKFYLDLEFDSSEDTFHEVSDTHLIYLMSDYDMTGIPNVHESSKKETETKTRKFAQKEEMRAGRQLLAYNNGDNVVEMYVICDPSMYSYYYGEYGSSWESEMESTAADYINDVSSEYSSGSWSSDIGDISVKLTKFDAITSYSGDFATLYPDYSTSDSIDGSGYLGKLKTFVSNYVSSSEIDNTQVWTKYSFISGAAGWGYIGTVCQGGGSCSNDVLNYGYDWGVRTMTHELGHNFGMSHDQDTTCGVDAGLMGYGSGNGFSYCSISACQSYFSQQSGLSCLYNDGGSTYTDDSSDDDTTWDTSTDDTSSDDDDDDEYCSAYSYLYLYSVGSLSSEYWYYGGCYNDAAYYYADLSGTRYYLYRSQYYTGYWFINTAINDQSTSAYCYQDNIGYCSGQWYYYSYGWVQDTDCVVYTYSSSSGMNTPSSYTITDTTTGNIGGTDTTDTDTTSDDGHGHVFNRNCTNNYGTPICLYNSGSLWDDGAASFNFDACKDDVPMFYYYYKHANGTVFYMLHYESYEDYNRWIISKNTAQDIAGEAYCEKEDLTECTYESWYVIDTSVLDVIDYIIDDSMGFDVDCVVDDDSATQYCDKSQSCAIWSVEYSIEDTSTNSNLCSDFYAGCVTTQLGTEWSDVYAKLHCEDDWDVKLSLNVSFSSGSNGYSTYENFNSQYATIFSDCDETADNSLSIIVMSSQLSICDDCDFVKVTDEEDDNEEQSSGVVKLPMKYAGSMIVAICTLFISVFRY